MKKTIPVKSFLGLCLVLGIVSCAFSEDAEVKLNSNDGTSKFIVQDKDAVTVFSADSDGNTVTNGTSTVAGAGFSVGGSTFVVGAGKIGIGTTAPAALLDVNGSAQFGSGATKSTFTALGALTLAGALTLPADPAAALQTATKQYVDTANMEPAACPAGMAYIPGPYPFCIDKYEAYLLSGVVSNDSCSNCSQAQVDANNTSAIAGSASGQTPLANINWCAAKKACQNAGKHLATNIEWFTAANYKGSKWNITDEEALETMACNTAGGVAHATGSHPGCVTQEGVYDMIGNLQEWVDFVVTADPTNGLPAGPVTGYDFATGIPTSTGTTSAAYGNDYYFTYYPSGTTRPAIRGGEFVAGSNAGVFSFAMNSSPTVYASVGFRCARKK